MSEGKRGGNVSCVPGVDIPMYPLTFPEILRLFLRTPRLRIQWHPVRQ